MRFAAAFLLSACALLLAGCLGPTPYQVRQVNGGYGEREAGTDRWYVEFYGNGFTARDTVLVYWMYRCAELTVQKGYDYFILIEGGSATVSALEIPYRQALDEDSEQGFTTVRVKGGGFTYVPIYTPGAAARPAWSARGTIQMFKGSPNPDEQAFVAKPLMDKLGPAVRQASQAGTNVALPAELREIQEGAQVGLPAQAGPAGSGVTLDDLRDLLPKE
jgi:hypothetical protein